MPSSCLYSDSIYVTLCYGIDLFQYDIGFIMCEVGLLFMSQLSVCQHVSDNYKYRSFMMLKKLLMFL